MVFKNIFWAGDVSIVGKSLTTSFWRTEIQDEEAVFRLEDVQTPLFPIRFMKDERALFLRRGGRRHKGRDREHEKFNHEFGLGIKIP